MNLRRALPRDPADLLRAIVPLALLGLAAVEGSARLPVLMVLAYADGIASRVAIPRAVELMHGRVDEMRTVSEDDLRSAQATLTEELGITVEGAAAASWAGVLAGPRPDGPVVVIVTGSNV